MKEYIAIKDISDNKEKYAKIFANGNKELESCLLKLWSNNIHTVASGSVNHKSYITISLDNENNEFIKYLKKYIGIISQVKTNYNYFEKGIGSTVTVCGYGNPNSFFRKLNMGINEYVEEYKRFVDIDLNQYDKVNPVSTNIIMSSNPTYEKSIKIKDKEYSMVNFNLSYGVNSLVAFSKETVPYKVCGYIEYEINKSTESIALNTLVMSEQYRKMGISSKLIDLLKEDINKMTILKQSDNIFVHPCATFSKNALTQYELEQFYSRKGLKLVNAGPSSYMYCPENYKDDSYQYAEPDDLTLDQKIDYYNEKNNNSVSSVLKSKEDYTR